jgi:hypothetical protein
MRQPPVLMLDSMIAAVRGDIARLMPTAAKERLSILYQ